MRISMELAHHRLYRDKVAKAASTFFVRMPIESMIDDLVRTRAAQAPIYGLKNIIFYFILKN